MTSSELLNLSTITILAPIILCGRGKSYPVHCRIFNSISGLYPVLCTHCRQHIDGSCSFIHSANLCLLIGMFTPFTFNGITDILGPKSAILFVFYQFPLFLFVSFFFLTQSELLKHCFRIHHIFKKILFSFKPIFVFLLKVCLLQGAYS